jgi:hypothetical protein
MPLDLSLGRPAVLEKRRLPDVSELVPVRVADRDPAEREEVALRELP